MGVAIGDRHLFLSSIGIGSNSSSDSPGAFGHTNSLNMMFNACGIGSCQPIVWKKNCDITPNVNVKYGNRVKSSRVCVSVCVCVRARKTERINWCLIYRYLIFSFWQAPFGGGGSSNFSTIARSTPD